MAWYARGHAALPQQGDSTSRAAIKDPSLSTSYRAAAELLSFHDQMNFQHEFGYDGSGNVTSMQLPLGGYLRWTYGTNAYSWSSPANIIVQQAVTNRVYSGGRISQRVRPLGRALVTSSRMLRALRNIGKRTASTR